jgi:hypothetical protein
LSRRIASAAAGTSAHAASGARRLTVVGFYRICVIDGTVPRSPADHVRAPTIASATDGLRSTHAIARQASVTPRVVGEACRGVPRR